MRILVAEDDAQLGDAITEHLRARGHAVDWVRDGADADAALRTHEFDLVVLDLGLPRQDGSVVLSRLRAREAGTPVLVVTARDAVGDRIAGLDAGADDYLVKPFALSELEARVRALLRRSQGRSSDVVLIGALAFDLSTRGASVGGERLDLSAREVAVLELLVARAGRAVAKEVILERLCDFDSDVSPNAIEVYVHRLRRKLAPHAVSIVTVRGLGYYLRAPA
jgi:DNA-binding response OmpR family regulator